SIQARKMARSTRTTRGFFVVYSSDPPAGSMPDFTGMNIDLGDLKDASMQNRIRIGVTAFMAVLLATGAFRAEAWCEEGRPVCRVPLLDDEAAWERLPEVEQASSRHLPHWARALADTLPRTTAAMLELDYLYRTSDAVDPRLRARMRWVAARANRCDYGA